MTPIELQIEDAWADLTSTRRARRFYLTAAGQLRYGEGTGKGDEEVGYYNRHVTLAAFREDVFHVYGQLKGACRGR